MTSYRVTYKEAGIEPSIAEFLEGSTVFPQNKQLTAPGRLEIRSSEGDLFRLQRNAQWILKEMEEGVQPEFDGEVFSIIIQAWPKAQNSCWNCKTHASAPLQLLIRKSSKMENTDEYLLAMGEMVIHEYDENGQYFVLCNLRQGDKAYVSYDNTMPVGPSRYRTQITRMSSEDWDYLLRNYLDHRTWM